MTLPPALAVSHLSLSMASALFCVLRASMTEEQCRRGEQGEVEGQRAEGEPGRSTLGVELILDLVGAN